MARKMDAHQADIAELAEIRAEIEKHKADLAALIKPLAKREEVLNAKLVKIMGASIVGTVDDHEVIERVNVARSTATKERVLRFAPEQFENIFVKGEKWKIKVL